MTRAPHIALMAAQTLPVEVSGDLPEWIHLLPAAHGQVQTLDARGPYMVEDAAAIVAASFAQGDRLPIDENHATDLAAPIGLPSPARGWITGMEVRADGIWGRVEWNAAGAELVKGHAYRAISPVILHGKNMVIRQILRASLVNRPNLRGLAQLNMESDMSLLERLAELLGIDKASSEDQVFDAVKKLHAAPASTALQSALGEIGVALGLAQDAGAEAIVAAAKVTKGKDASVVALQQELADVSKELLAIKQSGAKTRAESFVDGEITRGRVGVKPLRDHYIAMHMADPARVEKEIGAMPVLGAGGRIAPTPPAQADGEITLNAQQSAVARALGVAPKDYAATLKAERTNEEML